MFSAAGGSATREAALLAGVTSLTSLCGETLSLPPLLLPSSAMKCVNCLRVYNSNSVCLIHDWRDDDHHVPTCSTSRYRGRDVRDRNSRPRARRPAVQIPWPELPVTLHLDQYQPAIAVRHLQQSADQRTESRHRLLEVVEPAEPRLPVIRPVLAVWPLSCCRRVSRSLTLPHRGPIRTIPTGAW